MAVAVNQHLLQFKDVAELRTRTQTVQEASVNFKSEVLQFDTITLSNIKDKDIKFTLCSFPAFNIFYFICLLLAVKCFQTFNISLSQECDSLHFCFLPFLPSKLDDPDILAHLIPLCTVSHSGQKALDKSFYKKLKM